MVHNEHPDDFQAKFEGLDTNPNKGCPDPI